MARLTKALLLSLVAGGGAVDSSAGNGTAAELAFRAFVKRFGRVYSSGQEEQARLEIFRANYVRIEAENAQGKPYKLGINEFADQSPEEFSAGRFGLLGSAHKALWAGATHLGTDLYSGAPLAESMDWVKKGAVTPPKNQKQCGSCWAFSTTGSLEGAWQIATGDMVSLSEQQLVDCSKGGNAGCGGGSMDLAFEFLEKQPACSEDSYPYRAQNGKCHEAACSAGIPRGAVKGYKDVPADDEKALMEAVMQQPVSVAIEADQISFQMYDSGIITKKCGAKLDHGVLIVGYGTEGGIDYWKVKNSWGAQWGEDGYVRIERGVSKAGECGIKSQPSYPVVEDASVVVV